MAIRTGMQYLVDLVRVKSNAGTAQYTAGTIAYWTDDQIQDRLDRDRTWLVETPINFIPQNISGTTQFLTGVVGWKFLEQAESGTENWAVKTEAGGSIIGTADYTADYDEGRIRFDTDQTGTASDLTGYSYDVYKSAAEIVKEKIAYVDLWYDFSADAQTFSRSQIVASLKALQAALEEQIGSNNQISFSGNLKTSLFNRTDLNNVRISNS